ncbi:UNVERIFIED_CONTAM: hypothetical protein Cloal_3226 [Acetivibrio alkalicellulosi]
MSNKDNSLDSMMGELLRIKNEIINLSKKTGTFERVTKIKEEILENGWQNILQKYHPDINIDDPASNELFQLYKYVYTDMKKKLILK